MLDTGWITPVIHFLDTTQGGLLLVFPVVGLTKGFSLFVRLAEIE
jgi:hypothetical protein